MSLQSLLKQRSEIAAVPPVPSVKTAQGTEKPVTKQAGSLGSPGSLENTKEAQGTGHGKSDAHRPQKDGAPQRRTIQNFDSEGTREPENALLTPANSANQPADRYLDTDRRTCADCDELAPNGRCRAAARLELRQTAPWFAPDPDELRRCPAYQPGPEDPDQRPGCERWPNLARRFLVSDAKEQAA